MATDLATIGFEAETAGLNKAEAALDALAEKAGEVDSATQKVTKATKDQSDAAGKTAEAVKAETVAVQRLNEAQEKSRPAHENASNEVAKLGQRAAMTRNQLLTMQYTVNDVVASLASGTSPLTIMLQQGGQVTQAFGGLTQTLKSLGGYLLNPYVAALAAAAGGMALFVAATDDFDEATEKFNRSLQLTGNYAGVTKGQIDELVSSVALATGVSAGNVEEISSQLVASGQFAGRVIADMSMIIADYSQKSGMEIEKASEVITKAFENPSKGAEQLNKSLHFLSFAQLENIRNLQEQNRLEEAQIALGSALQAKLQETSYNVGLLASKWMTLKAVVGDAINAMSFDKSVDERLDVANERLLKAMQAMKAAASDTERARAQSTIAAQKAIISEIQGAETAAAQQGAKQREEAAAIAARNDIETWKKAHRTKAEMMADELAATERVFAQKGLLEKTYNNDAVALERDKQERLAGIRKKYEEKAKKPKVTDEQKEAKALDRAYESTENSLSRQVALLGDATEYGRVYYEVTEGGLRSLLPAQQEHLLALANQIDVYRDLEQGAKDYAKAARDAEREAREQEREREESIRAMEAKARDDRQNRIELQGIDSDLGGEFADRGEADRLQMQAEEDLQFLRDQLEAKAVTQEEYAARELALRQKLADDIRDIEDARMRMEIQTAGDGFDSLASITKAFAGEQSGAYKAMFAISKAFAIADSLVQISNGVAKAANNPWPANLAAMASVAAAGASIVANIKAVNDVGFMEGGYTGNGPRSEEAGVVHGQEYVFDAQSTARIGVGNLEAIRRGESFDSAAGGRGTDIQFVNQSKNALTSDWADTFDSLASMAESFADKQSDLHKAMFAVSQGMANALKEDWSLNIAAMSQIAAADVSNVADIRAIDGSGFMGGGYTGTWDRGEVDGVASLGADVFDGSSSAGLGVDDLEAIRRGGAVGAASGSPVVNIQFINQSKNALSADVEYVTADEVRIIVREQVPTLMAREAADPYSKFSKSQQANTNAGRKF